MLCRQTGLPLLLISIGSCCLPAQVPSGTAQPVAQAPPPPVTILIKKTIVFLETDCLHDFEKDSASLTREALLQMPPIQQQNSVVRLSNLALKLQSLKQKLKLQFVNDKSLTELSPQDVTRLMSNPNPNATSEQNADQIEWRLRTLITLNKFTDEEIASLSDQDLTLIALDQYRGTGFLVGYPDSRIKRPPGESQPRLFPYLATNRHVIQPGIEHGAPCKIVRSFVLLNRKPDATHTSTYGETDRIDQSLKWTTSPDDSVDLAVTGIGLDESKYDHVLIPTSQFVSDDEVKNHKVVEGDPVLFAGLFVQTFNQLHTLEPIVRSGSLAMIPEESLRMTLGNKPGHVYLAEVHAFGGNSGSPMFVDSTKFAAMIMVGTNLKLLGVISQEVFENSDLTLTVATSMSGNITGNSGVSVVVPVSELAKLLDDPSLKAARDHQIELQQGSANPH